MRSFANYERDFEFLQLKINEFGKTSLLHVFILACLWCKEMMIHIHYMICASEEHNTKHTSLRLQVVGLIGDVHLDLVAFEFQTEHMFAV